MDTLNFDGSCDPNPGGIMGFGWVINWSTGKAPTEGSKEKKSSPSNTNNVAEYTALKEGISNYLKLGGKGPLQVYGDSKLVINQMSGTWKINNQNLLEINKQIASEIKKHDLKVKFGWVPREQNTTADRLAMPGSSSKNSSKTSSKASSIKPEERKFVADVNSSSLSPQLRLKINELNTEPSPGFKSFAQLKVGGMDSFSRKKLEELQEEAGKKASSIVQNEFPKNLTHQASALRWMLRGLSTDLAVRKVQIDVEISKKKKR
ncbi:ribonuclease HI family protein [Methanolobus mangrovi]|uniref:Ribonuclease HI family protein n=1 Tax=Methanolobus mangrovi TaxID=3072977 RepID=A0AA51UEM8_9EURY|nr:ribonuclease HI family protein [Methanolobus mangrovi]WMW21733.1 ribonuclease HI family protein [Methanolobus mangrovi]